MEDPRVSCRSLRGDKPGRSADAAPAAGPSSSPEAALLRRACGRRLGCRNRHLEEPPEAGDRHPFSDAGGRRGRRLHRRLERGGPPSVPVLRGRRHGGVFASSNATGGGGAPQDIAQERKSRPARRQREGNRRGGPSRRPARPGEARRGLCRRRRRDQGPERKRRVRPDRGVGARAEGRRRSRVQRNPESLGLGRIRRNPAARREHASKDHPAHSDRPEAEGAERAFHRQVRDPLYLRCDRGRPGHVSHLLARLRAPGLRELRRDPLGLLPGDDAHGRREPVRARPVDSLGDPGRDRVGGASRSPFSRGRRNREACGYRCRGARQDGHPDDGRAERRRLREFSRGQGARGSGDRLRPRIKIAASDRARDRPACQGAGCPVRGGGRL